MKKLALFAPQNLSLLRELVITDFKLRYQGSVLGYVWSLLRPMMLFSVLYVVFTQVFKLGDQVPFYPAYLLLGIVLWTFWAEATSAGMGSIVARGDLIRKVSMPRYIVVLSTTLSAAVNLFLNLVVVGIFMALTGVPLRLDALLFPLLLVELVALATAASFLLSALYVRFRDFSHIWEVVLQILFYATPIIYPLSFVPEKMAKLISLSPLTQIIQDARQILITPAAITPPEIWHSATGWLAPVLVLVATAIVAVWYFKRRSRDFAENL